MFPCEIYRTILLSIAIRLLEIKYINTVPAIPPIKNNNIFLP